MKFTKCVDKVEKIVSSIDRFHFFLSSSALWTNPEIFLTIFWSLWIMKFCRTTIPKESSRNTAILGYMLIMLHQCRLVWSICIWDQIEIFCFFHWKFVKIYKFINVIWPIKIKKTSFKMFINAIIYRFSFNLKCFLSDLSFVSLSYIFFWQWLWQVE